MSKEVISIGDELSKLEKKEEEGRLHGSAESKEGLDSFMRLNIRKEEKEKEVDEVRSEIRKVLDKLVASGKPDVLATLRQMAGFVKDDPELRHWIILTMLGHERRSFEKLANPEEGAQIIREKDRYQERVTSTLIDYLYQESSPVTLGTVFDGLKGRTHLPEVQKALKRYVSETAPEKSHTHQAQELIEETAQ